MKTMVSRLFSPLALPFLLVAAGASVIGARQALADVRWDYMHMWQEGTFGVGHMILAGSMMIFSVALVVVVIISILRLFRSRADGALLHRASAMEILEDRFARGEIDQDEFLKGKKELAR